jgi:imidazolonepropionase-like amidohydrolase
MSLRVRFAAVLFLSWVSCACSDDKTTGDGPSPASSARAYVGGTVIPAPNEPAIEDGVVLVEGEQIVAVGPRSAVQIPRGATRIDCSGGTVLSGFWNSHVHFMAPEWDGAANANAAALEHSLREMLTRWGFVHVADLGSELDNTLALRQRIESGELRGPSILTAGAPFITSGGQPIYVPQPLPELTDSAQATASVEARLDAGADLIKLMTASVVENPPPPVMPLEVVRAATHAAHARQRLVFAHPTNADGVWAAVDGGVDVLAHTAPDMGPWSADDVARLRGAGVRLTPTLSLFRYEMEKDDESEESMAEVEALVVGQLEAFRAAGGAALFGTDVGYTTLFDPSAEYALLQRAGLDFDAILSSLTTAPAELFEAEARTGRLLAGSEADLVVLEGDPRTEVSAWTRVKLAVRAGQTLFER